MKKLYTGLRFNNKNYSDLLNVSLENDMPEENLRGHREIIEDQIPGRDIPYFYEVKDEPLEFDVVFALKKPMTKAAIRQIVQEFLSPRIYKELEFGTFDYLLWIKQSPTYNIIFTEETSITYTDSIDQNGINQFVGYFTLHARCDRPYGYQKVEITKNELKETYSDPGDPKFNTISIINPGFLAVKPNIIIKNGPSARSPFRIFNYTNNTSMTFDNFAVHELINYNADLKIFSNSSVYAKWNRDELILEPGENLLMFECILTVDFEGISIFYANIKFEAPRII
jgi:hypothetical protein